MDEVIKIVRLEVENAEERYGPFASTHEGYGVLAEECAELLDAIRCNDLAGVERESIQVAAVAIRLAMECTGIDNLFAQRSIP
jgi:NTP pyrophosphatase (non-canonical NTP hydrolase)